MKKKSILIVGSKGLIGKALTEGLKKNYNIIKVDKNISSSNLSYKCDLNNQKSFEKLLLKLKKNKIKLFAAINTVYPQKSSNFLQTDTKKLIKYISKHLVAYYNFNKKLYDFFSREKGKKIIINFSSIYGSKIPNFKIYEKTKIKMPIEYSISKSGLNIMNKYFAEWSKFKKKKIFFFSISPAGISADQPRKFHLNYKKYYKSKMLTTSSLVKIVNKILNSSNRNNGKNFFLAGKARI